MLKESTYYSGGARGVVHEGELAEAASGTYIQHLWREGDGVGLVVLLKDKRR